MKFYLWSDIHNEFGKIKFEPHLYNKEYPLIIAGDFGTGDKVPVKLIKELTQHFNDVLIILGNHDFYNSSFKAVRKTYSNLAKEISNLHYLHNDSVVINGCKFIGSTLWTGMSNSDPIMMFEAPQVLNDFRYIKELRETWDPSRLWVDKHQVALNYILTEVEKDLAIPKVIITHHAPHPICTPDEYKESPYNYLYTCDSPLLENLFFEKNNIKAWCHGHIHAQDTVYLNGIPIFRNARGYVNYEDIADSFEQNLLFEI